MSSRVVSCDRFGDHLLVAPGSEGARCFAIDWRQRRVGVRARVALHAAADARQWHAAKAREGRGDVALTQLRYPEAAGDMIQANLVVVPRHLAFDFLLFCQRNPRACPLLAVGEPGQWNLSRLIAVEIE